MVPWIPYAFVRFLLFFTSGILLGIYYPGVISISVGKAALSGLVVVYFLIVVFRRDHIAGFNPGLFGLPILILLGYLVVWERTESNRADHIANSVDGVDYYTVTITSYPEEKEKSWKEIGEVMALKDERGWRPSSGKVLLYLTKEEVTIPFSYGDVLLIKGTPKAIAPPSNPYEFDYKRFLRYKNIHHQDFISKSEVLVLDNDPPNFLIKLAYAARAKSMAVIKKNVSGKREQAIASALILGITDSLDNDLLNAYAASGAIHVLAVSGLHVGVLYAIIMFVLLPLKKFSSGKWIIAIVSIVCLWSYAMLTGLSPSVMRAVTMFSFVVVAGPLQKRSNIYNTLALSAFCLLLYNPYFIMSVGFQLSYLAVLGIVYLYPRLFLVWTPSSWGLTQVWRVTCVSLSAQLATFSLGLLYFHQFPVYFLVTNLFVIPLSFTTLVLGLLMICVNFLTPVVDVIGMILTYTIKLLNGVVLMTERLPGSLITGIQISTFQCYLLVALLVTIIIMVRFRKFSVLYISSALACWFSIIQWNEWSATQTAKMVVYNVRGYSAMDIIHSGNAYHFSDSVLREKTELADFQIKGNRIAQAVTNVVSADCYPFVRPSIGSRIIYWNNISVIQIHDKDFTIVKNFPIDYLVISNNAISSLQALTGKVNCRYVIIDSSNSTHLANSLMKEANELHQRVHSVLHDGAFVTEL